jgi:hypothetical protein
VTMQSMQRGKQSRTHDCQANKHEKRKGMRKEEKKRRRSRKEKGGRKQRGKPVKEGLEERRWKRSNM